MPPQNAIVYIRQTRSPERYRVTGDWCVFEPVMAYVMARYGLQNANHVMVTEAIDRDLAKRFGNGNDWYADGGDGTRLVGGVILWGLNANHDTARKLLYPGLTE